MEIEGVLDTTDHRPWPLPSEPWIMTMGWYDLLFAHWPVPVDSLRSQIPPGLKIDTFNGQAWIGVVPFRMRGVRPRFVPRAASRAFPELNVRTYVTATDPATGEERPGVWFFSLDATSFFAVRAARWIYQLPYFDAKMKVQRNGNRVDYASIRQNRPAARFTAGYRPVGAPYHAEPGTLDYWLTERYRLYTALPGNRIAYADIHHVPWPLQKAQAHIAENTMAHPLGIELQQQEPLLHFSADQLVVAWRLMLL